MIPNSSMVEAVADADMVMDSANPYVELMQAMVKITTRFPPCAS